MTTKNQTKKTSCKQTIDGLCHLLADTYILYLKTQNFHWNVTGPHFASLHSMFEEQYRALAETIDEIAERIRALGSPTPASFKKYLMLSSLDEASPGLKSDAMVKELLHDHEVISKNLEKLFATAEKAGDEVTLDLFIQRKFYHDKIAWMLHSTLE